MKNAKKFLAFLLIALLVLSLSATAFADDSITISVHDSGEDDENSAAEVYTAYKIFDVVKGEDVEDPVTTDDTIGGGEETGFAYTIDVDSPWYSVVADELGDYITLTAIPGDDTKKVVGLKDGVANSEATAKAIAAILEENIPDDAAGIEVTLEESATAAPGYYLVVSSIGTNLILGTSNIEITQKNSYPTIKKLEKDADRDFGTEAEAGVGDIITYQITVAVPETAKVDITVTDTLCDFLDYTTGSIEADGFTEDTDYEVESEAAHGFVLTIHPTAATKGEDFVFTYEAVVNADAVNTADDAKINTVQLDFSNFRQTDSVPFTLSAGGVFKYDGASEDEAPLEGVKFTLKLDGELVPVTKSGDYYIIDTSVTGEATEEQATVVTDAEGLIVIRGLDGDKEYTLTETETLPGYNMLSEDVTLTLVADNDQLVVDADAFDSVPNYMGTVLPSTGGVGTTIFYVVGGLMVLGAGVMLITKKRMSKEG